jgi:hypothetical protein
MNNITLRSQDLEILEKLVEKELDTITNRNENDGNILTEINAIIQGCDVKIELGLILYLNDNVKIDIYDVIVINKDGNVIECNNFNDVNDILTDRMGTL